MRITGSIGALALVAGTLAGSTSAELGAAPAAATAAGTAALAASALAPAEAPSPAVSSLRDGRSDVFTRSAGGHLLHQYRPPGGSWTRNVDLGGSLASQPAAASWAPGRVDVFGRGTDGALWHRWNSGGTWSRWESLGGQIASAPAVAAWTSGRLDVFARGTDDALLHRYYERGVGWSGWVRFGGLALTSSPAVAAWEPGRLDVFARGSTNRIHHLWFRSSAGWSAWEDLGGASTSQPAAAAPGVGVLDVAVLSPDGTMSLRHYQRGAGWSGWTSLGGHFTSGPGAAAIGDDVRIAGRATNGFPHEAVRPSPTAAWTPWTIIDPYLPFRGLGTWVDVFDYPSLDPATAVPAMRSRGVRVLYLATARFNGTTDLFDAAEAGQWLDIAHANGMRVVGWYLPAYGDMDRDVRRTVAVAQFVSPGGQRFDAVGVDIERLDEVSLAQFNTALVTHLRFVRELVDTSIGAIVPSPFGTDAGNRWAGFPWAAVGQNSEVVVPMALWSFRSNPDGSAYSADQVYTWVLDQVTRARTMTGRRVSVEGGVLGEPNPERTPVTLDRVRRFVDAALDGGAIGGSNYDYLTTLDTFWPELARLNR
ncbi:MAG TPA: hypothetical protein VK306_02240 [Acidimicrobiales bacterium]|nr:hypothetical protein [Acidimicrobiales bacterium]